MEMVNFSNVCCQIYRNVSNNVTIPVIPELPDELNEITATAHYIYP
jgi:hypothetical protein